MALLLATALGLIGTAIAGVLVHDAWRCWVRRVYAQARANLAEAEALLTPDVLARLPAEERAILRTEVESLGRRVADLSRRYRWL